MSQARFFLQPSRNFEVTFLKWHAAGISEIHATFRRDPAVRRRLMLSRGAGSLVSGSFHRYGITEIHFHLIDTVGMVYATSLTGLAANFLLRKPDRRVGDLPAWCDKWCLSGSILKKLRCNCTPFSVSKSGNPGGSSYSLRQLKRW